MAHPKETKRSKGIIWHLEDSKLALSEARALKKHLTKTEGKKAKYTHEPNGYKVWWTRR